MFLRSLLVFTCIAALTAAQEGVESERARMKREGLQEESDAKASGDKGAGDAAADQMTPEQRLNHNVRAGASAYCRFVVSMKPAKLMPGQTGTMIVTTILLGQAVLPSPAPVEILSPAQQGLVTIGAAAFRQAGPGKLASGYLGKPVYDNFAIFELPVTVAQEAVVGRKLPINLDLKLDLYDGVSAQPVGRFTDRLAAEIEVGQVADPSVLFRGAMGSGTGSSRPVIGTDAAAAKPADVGAEKPAPMDASPKPLVHAATPQAPEAPSNDAPPPVEDEAGLPLPPALLIGGGAAIAVLLLLLWKRK